MYAWEGLGADADLTRQVEARMPSEEKWYALTGRVVDAKVEADGDIHIALEDATGNRRCHRGVGAKVLTNLCQEWFANSLSFCCPTETEVDVGRSEYQRDNDSDD